MIKLLDFLKTRTFHGVPLGANPEELVAAIGKPGHEYTDTFAHTLEYGLFEFAFTREAKRLYLVHTQDFETPTLGYGKDMDPWILKAGVPIKDVLEAAEQQGMECSYDPETLTLKFNSGVDLVFYGENPDTATLYSIEARDMGIYEQDPAKL